MFSMIPDEVKLPPLVPGTENRLALPRPNTPLACVIAPRSADLHNTAMNDGHRCSTEVLVQGLYHVVPQVGHQMVVSSSDVGPADAWDPFRAFTLGGPADLRDPVRPALQRVWDNGTAETVEVLTLQRVLPAFVVGRIIEEPADIDPEQSLAYQWLETSAGRWRTLPGAWIIREMSWRSVRVVPTLYMGREFIGISSTEPAMPFETTQG